MPTQRDIAERLGVSVATVSLALRRDPQISVEMRSRVLATAEEMGYTYQPRKDGATASARLAFVCSYTMTDVFYAPVLDAAERECQRHGATMRFVQTARQDPLHSIHEIDALDGALLIGMYGASVVRAFEKYGLPVVLIDNDVPEVRQDRVLINNEASLYQTTRWLYDLGHRRIAHIHGPHEHRSFGERLAGYRRAMRDLSLEPLVLGAGDVDGVITLEDTTRHFSAWLAAQPALPFTAVTVCLDKAAIAVMRVLQSAGYRVPEDVAVVGFDDIDAAAVVNPPLTTNHVPRDILGRLGTRLLLDRLAHPHYPPIRTVIDAKLVERGSTGPAPA